MRTTKYQIIGRTNSYIANRDIHFNGKTTIVIDSNLTLKEAQRKLLDFYNDDYNTYYSNWGLVRCNDPHRTSTHKDGTRSYEYDSRYYSIEVDTSVYSQDILFNFKGADLEWTDEDGDKFRALLGNDYLDRAEYVKPVFAEALTECREDGDPVVSIEKYMEEQGYPIPIQFELG